ncbi:MAG TPA: energy transducer TonB [Candidatus Cloacimonetes bacterium]|nr:energy transducer TonB [Candidatus Cloacimonadota bacterium]
MKNIIFSLMIILIIISSFGCSSTKTYKRKAEQSSLTPLIPTEIYSETEFGKTPKDFKYTEPPVIERQFPPEYPEEAKAKGWEGKVLLNVEILDNGQIGMIEIIESSGYPILDESAVKAAKTWKLSPAKNGNETVGVWVEFPIEFKID